MNLALGDLPSFPSLAGAIGQDGYCARFPAAFTLARKLTIWSARMTLRSTANFPSAPYLDVTIPTILDPSLAPDAKHVLSAYVQFAPYKLKQGNWSARRKELGDVVVKTLAHVFARICRLWSRRCR